MASIMGMSNSDPSFAPSSSGLSSRVKVHPITITAEGHLLCPVCGEEYTHIGELIQFVTASDCGYGFDTEGYHRGGGLKLWMHGECGHKWKLHIQHHKGATSLFTSIPEEAQGKE